MDDFKVIFYIIGAIIYFVFQFKKKKNEVEQNKPKPKPVTQQQPPVYNKQHKNVRSAIDELLERERSSDTVVLTKHQAKKAESLEQTKKRVKASEAISLEKTVKNISLEKDSHYHENMIDRSGKHFKPFDIEVAKKHQIVKMLKSKEGIRQAFIASEILKPKHF